VEINLVNHTPLPAADADWILQKLREVAALQADTPDELVVAIVDDATMADLHVRHLGLAGPTDVLTYPLAEVDGRVVEGEVVLCHDEAARQAAARGHDVRDELLLYAIHGLLHLSSYDDLRAADAARMHAREDELLDKVGVGARYEIAKSRSSTETGH
jgi:probable rRNA maturation factor